MMKDIFYRFSEEKNALLKKERGVSFEEVVFLIENDFVLAVVKNRAEKFKHQIVYIIAVDNYAYAVPCVLNGNEVFLKTIYPSRVYTKKYMNKEAKNEQSKKSKKNK